MRSSERVRSSTIVSAGSTFIFDFRRLSSAVPKLRLISWNAFFGQFPPASRLVEIFALAPTRHPVEVVADRHASGIEIGAQTLGEFLKKAALVFFARFNLGSVEDVGDVAVAPDELLEHDQIGLRARVAADSRVDVAVSDAELKSPRVETQDCLTRDQKAVC